MSRFRHRPARISKATSWSSLIYSIIVLRLLVFSSAERFSTKFRTTKNEIRDNNDNDIRQLNHDDQFDDAFSTEVPTDEDTWTDGELSTEVPTDEVTLTEETWKDATIMTATQSPTPVRPAWWDFTPTDPPTRTPTTASLTTPFPTPNPTVAPIPLATAGPTVAPSLAPVTAPPTEQPTVKPTTASPTTSAPTTSSPTKSIAGTMESIQKTNGGQDTSCTFIPQSGSTKSDSLDLEYFLYLNDNVEDPSSNITTSISRTTTPEELQNIVDTLQTKLHYALALTAMNCSDFVSRNFALVGLSHNGPGSDNVGAQCPVNTSTTTSCYQVWAKMNVTMWFSGSRRRYQRQLQSSSPFGSNDAFAQFVVWLNDAFATLQDQELGVVDVIFQGFVNLNGFDGTVLEDPKNVGVDPTDAFIGSSSEAQTQKVPFSYGQIAIVVGGVVFLVVVFFALRRLRSNQRAYMKHKKEVDDLQLDITDDWDDSPHVVDDASLFQEEDPLPEEFEVQLEEDDHDYRTCALPTCRACLQRRDPIFVSTERRDFDRNLSNLHPEKYHVTSSSLI